jgi:hypothetical protein
VAHGPHVKGDEFAEASAVDSVDMGEIDKQASRHAKQIADDRSQLGRILPIN